MSLQSIFGGGSSQPSTAPQTPDISPPPAPAAPAPAPSGDSDGGFFHTVGSTIYDLLATTRPGRLIRELHEQRMQDDLMRAKAWQDPGFQAYALSHPDVASRFHVETAPMTGDWRQDPDTAAREAAFSTGPVTDSQGNVIQDPTAATFHPSIRLLNAPPVVETKERAGIRLLGAQAGQEEAKTAQEQAAARMLGGAAGGDMGGYAKPEVDIAPGGPTFKFKPRTIKEISGMPDQGVVGAPGPGPTAAPGPSPAPGRPPAAAGGRPAAVTPVAPVPTTAPGQPHPHYPQGAAVDADRLKLARDRTGGGAAPGGPPPAGAPGAEPAPAPEKAAGGPPAAPTPTTAPAPAATPAAPPAKGGLPEFPKAPNTFVGPDGNVYKVKEKPVSEEGKALLDAAGDDRNPNRDAARAMIFQAKGNPDDAIANIPGAATLAQDQIGHRKAATDVETKRMETADEVMGGVNRVRQSLNDPRFARAVAAVLPEAHGRIEGFLKAEGNRLGFATGQYSDPGNIAYLQSLNADIIPLIRAIAVSSKGNRITLPEIDLFGGQFRQIARGEATQTFANNVRDVILHRMDLIEHDLKSQGQRAVRVIGQQ